MRTLFVALLAALIAASALAQGRPGSGELRRVRVLVIADTDSDLATSVKIDLARIRALFAVHVPKSRYTLDVLDGKKVTRQNVLDYYRNLKPARDEAVVCFFAGHGAIDKRRGHYLQMRPARGPVLLRSELRAAMYASRPALMVLLTDCCSNHVNLTVPDAEMPAAPPKKETKPEVKLHPTLRELLFVARGVVDVTGTQAGTSAWGDDKEGGVFTRSVCRTLLRPVRELDGNRDGQVTWKEAFAHLRTSTSTEFKRWKHSIPAADRGSIRQDDQKPHAFLIRENARAAPPFPTSPPAAPPTSPPAAKPPSAP
jgi:hypothetical protein